MSKEKQLTEMIIQTKEWYDSKRQSLSGVIENKDYKIKFANTEGEDVELPEEHKTGFILGLQMALEIFGEFPVTITRTENGDK